MLSKRSTRLILLVCVLSIYCLLVGHKVLTLGKNADGVEYAAVARNMAEGQGTLWSPYLDDTRYPRWYENPPLVLWMQSLFFRLFGDGPYFEGIYGFFIGIVNLLLTALFWQQVRRDFQWTYAGGWWPMLLLISIPSFTYYMQTNRLAITFMSLALLAALAAYRSIVGSHSARMHALLCGVLIYLGFIAKGPVALFPLALPALAWIVFRVKFSRMLFSTAVALVSFSVLFLATLYCFPQSRTFWNWFWLTQITASWTDLRASQGSYWYYALRLIRELPVPLLVICMLMLVTRIHPRHFEINRPACFMLLLTLACSLPFFFSRRQNLRYLLQSYPFFSMALAFIANPVALKIEEILDQKRKFRLAVVMAVLVFVCISFAAMLYRKGHVIRRERFYRDFYLADIQLPARSWVSLCSAEGLEGDWTFVVDMQRFYKVSMTTDMGHDYLVINKNSNCQVPDGYQKVHRQPTLKYVLYRRVSSEIDLNKKIAKNRTPVQLYLLLLLNGGFQ